MLKSIAEKMKNMEEKQIKMLEVQAEHEKYLKKKSTDDAVKPEPQTNFNGNSSIILIKLSANNRVNNVRGGQGGNIRGNNKGKKPNV